MNMESMLKTGKDDIIMCNWSSRRKIKYWNKLILKTIIQKSSSEIKDPILYIKRIHQIAGKIDLLQ